jgi:hypothetical protein
VPEEPIQIHPEKQFHVTMMLADAAVEAGRKLTIAGAGWTQISAIPTPFAVCGWVAVPWELMDQAHQGQLKLVDADGQTYRLPDGQPLQLPPDNFSVQRLPGIRPGMAENHFFMVQIGGLPLNPGQRYVWELWINGKTHDDWRLPFNVADAPPEFGGAEEAA